MATPALVQQSTVQQITSGTTGTFTITVTAGNCLVIAVATALNAGVSVLGTPTDPNNVWVTGTTAANTGAGGSRSALWFVNNCVGGTYVITMTLGAAVKANWEVYEFSGVGSIAGNRSIVDASGTGLTSAATAGSAITPQQSGSLALAFVSDGGTATTWTKDASATSLSQTSTNIDFASSYRVLSSTSIAAATLSFTTGAGAVQFAWACIILRPLATQATVRLVDINLNSASPLVTGSYTPKLGAVLLAVVKTGTSGKTTTSAADSAASPANTWTLVAGSRSVDGSGGELSAWICNGVANAASATFTATVSAATIGHITILELSGVIPNANTVDQVLTATGSGTAISVGPTGTTAIPGELALLCVGAPTTFGTSTNGGSTALHANTSSADSSILIESLVLNAVGTQTMTATLGSSSQWGAVLITLQTGAQPFTQSASTASASLAAGVHNGFLSLTFNTAPGDSLVAAFQTGANQTVTALTDSRGNTWTKVEGTAGGANGQNTLWATSGVVGGKISLNVTNAGTTGPLGVILYQFSGSLTFDVGTTNTGNSQIASTGTTPTPSYLSEVFIASSGDAGSGRIYAPTAPYTAPNVQSVSANLVAGFATVFQPGVVPSGQSTSFAIPGGANVQWLACFASFKLSGSNTYYALNGSVTATGTTSGTLTETSALTATSSATATTAGTALHSHVPNGATSTVATSTAQLLHSRATSVAISAVSAASATMTHTRQVVASIPLTGAVLGVLGRVRQWRVAASLATSITGNQSATSPFKGTAGASLTAALVAHLPFVNTFYGPQPIVKATVTHRKPVSATISHRKLVNATVTHRRVDA